MDCLLYYAARSALPKETSRGAEAAGHESCEPTADLTILYTHTSPYRLTPCRCPPSCRWHYLALSSHSHQVAYPEACINSGGTFPVRSYPSAKFSPTLDARAHSLIYSIRFTCLLRMCFVENSKLVIELSLICKSRSEKTCGKANGRLSV